MKNVIIIAEAGVNHNGDMNLARELIRAAAKCGVDFVKFQTWVTDELIDTNAPKASYQLTNDGSETNQYDMLKRLELSFEDFRNLKKYADEIGISFLSTPDDILSLNFLVDELKMDIIKVGSAEISNIPFLRRIGGKQKDVILSTGMATMDEVVTAYDILHSAGAKSIAVLHCTSKYPADYESVNLKAMLSLGEQLGCRIGYSDHTVGNEVSIAAVAMGAQIIEKHFTINKLLPGPDHRASIDTQELTALVNQIRNIEKAVSGDGKKVPQLGEEEIRKVVTKGIYARYNLLPGDKFAEENLMFKRPAGEVAVDQFDLVVGKSVKREIHRGEQLRLTDIT